MGFLFGGNSAKNADRIEELEERLDEARSRADNAMARARSAEDWAEDYAETAVTIAQAAQENALGDLDTVNSKTNTVETLDEPKIAWKATQNFVVKLLLPEGAQVVHPESGDKKRADEAVVLSFHEVDERPADNTFADVHRMEEYVVEDPALATTDNSKYDYSFEYNIGERVTPNNGFNTSTTSRCTAGIHFFCSKEAALHWFDF